MMEKSKHATLHPFLFFLSLILSHPIQLAQIVNAQKNTTLAVNVGVVLDLDTWFGKMGSSCISMALSDFYTSHSYYKTRILLNNRDSKGDVVGSAAAALDLLKNTEVQAIIGPFTSMQADFIIDLGDKAQVPIISFSATSPSLSSIRSPYFIRATQNDSSQVRAISSIVKAFGWREVVPIYVDDEFGEGIIPFLTDAMDEINARVPYRSVIPPLATDDYIVAELYKLMTMQTRVFIVHMFPSLVSRLFTKAKQLGMMSEDYAWIITNAITDGLTSIDPSVVLDSMQGVLGVKTHVPNSAELQSFSHRWKLKFQQDNLGIINPQLNVFGLWAYDSATALAMAIEEAGISDLSFQKKSNSPTNSTDLETFGVSKNGPKLLQSIFSTSFKGLSGDFNIRDGQLQSPPYQIVNIIGTSAKEIGFWTADRGIVRQLNISKTRVQYSTKKSNFGAIIWPGDVVRPPKGWVIPTNGKKLRVGVPVKDGFGEFVKGTRDPETSTTTIEGYSIAVFEAVMASLPYAVPYKYVQFATSNGTGAGSYNDLVYQVFLGNYDIVAGDVTIRANRSQYVDFSLPYTESGVSMIVPVVDNKNNAWIFLQPLSWELWLTSFSSIIIIGILIWILEHRTNKQFRGPPSYQIGTIFWFSFSTMVFAHKEKIFSNLARFVLIIWFLVVLILTQSYTASLTSMLTVRQLQPTITSIDELIKNKAYVGYNDGSFVLGLLLQKGFDESRLLAFDSPDELEDLFTKGSRYGKRIVAAFDEIPYLKLFLAIHCSMYTMVEPTYKTDGFGFVFPIGSPLVRDVSRAILNITEGDKMVEIEKAWIPEASNCKESSTSISSDNLTLRSFWGLFLIVAIAAFIAIVVYLTTFLHEHWHIVTDPDSSVWSKIKELCWHFDNKDLTSHTFKKQDEMGISPPSQQPQSPITFSLQASPTFSLQTSPLTTEPPSPSLSSHTDQNLNLSEEHGTQLEEIEDHAI